MPPNRSLAARLATTLLALLGTLALLLTLAPTPADAATKTPPTPTDLPSGIESLAAYVPANSCSPVARPGTHALGDLLVSTYPNTSFGGSRACGALPDSEHHDGRAVDWMNSIRNKTQKKQATAVIKWLLATDADGNRYANARRLGIMYIIWDGKIWGAYNSDRGWREYAGCSSHPEKGWDTTCHRDHMHLSLSWAGAMKRTSYWSGKVAAEDYGRCKPADLNWAYTYKKFNPNRCSWSSRVYAPKGASALLKTLTQYSGRPFKTGHTGAGVSAVQKAVKAPVTGRYDADTVAKVAAFQRKHHINDTGRMSYATWRALLKAKAPQ